MQATDFHRFIGLVGELTARQRDIVCAALAADEAAEALTLIEARFGAAPLCGHCQSANVQKWGKRGGLSRYRCRDCRRTFNALTGAPLARLRKRSSWIAYARALVDGLSVRKAAKCCGLDPTTAFRWRHRFLSSIAETKAKRLEGIVEADEAFFLRSEKGSRHLTRLPRKRGGSGAPAKQAQDQVPVLIARDRHGGTTDAVMADKSAASISAVLASAVVKDAVLVSDGAQAYRSFAVSAGILHIGLIVAQGERTRGVYHIQNVNAYVSRLKGWMARFKGVATKYLGSYLGWRRLLDREGEHATPELCLTGALA